jgi:hypothetical protein
VDQGLIVSEVGEFGLRRRGFPPIANAGYRFNNSCAEKKHKACQLATYRCERMVAIVSAIL